MRKTALSENLFSVFLRWYGPDQVQGFDLSPSPLVTDRRDTPNGKSYKLDVEKN